MIPFQRPQEPPGFESKVRSVQEEEMGRDDYEHAGMVRAIFEQESGFSWAELTELVGDSAPGSGSTEPRPQPSQPSGRQ